MSVGLAKNTFYLTFASVAQKAIAFLYFALIARLFGDENTGAYFISLAVITVIMVLDDLGLTGVLIRETAKNKSQAVLWIRSVIGVKIFTMPLTIVIAFFTPVLLGYSEEVIFLVRIAVVVMLADTISLSFYGVLRGLQTVKYEALGIFFGQLITAVLGVSFIVTGVATLPLLIVALMAGSLWNVFFSVTQVVKHVGLQALVPTYSLGWKPLKMASAFFLAATFVKIYSYADSFILQEIIGEAAVGQYAVAYKLTYAFQFLPLAFVAALYPTMSAESQDIQKLKQTLLNALWYMGLMGFPIIFGIFSLAPEIILAFYGEDFQASILPLQILIFVLFFIFLDFPLGSLLNATNRQYLKTGIMGATMVINVIANVILIPRFGVPGASVAALFSFAFMFASGWYFTQRVVRVRAGEVVQRLGGLFLASVLMSASVLLLKPFYHLRLGSGILEAIVFFMASILTGMLVFFFVAVATKSLTRDHFRFAKRLLMRSSYVEDSARNS